MQRWLVEKTAIWENALVAVFALSLIVLLSIILRGPVWARMNARSAPFGCAFAYKIFLSKSILINVCMYADIDMFNSSARK